MALARAARRDPGEWAVIHALRARGCFVRQVDGYGLPDLGVVPFEGPYAQAWVWLEVKEPPGPRGGTSKDGQRLNDAQVEFFAASAKHGFPCFMVYGADDALEKLGLR